MGADVITIRFIMQRKKHNFIRKSNSSQAYYCLLLTSGLKYNKDHVRSAYNQNKCCWVFQKQKVNFETQVSVAFKYLQWLLFTIVAVAALLGILTALVNLWPSSPTGPDQHSK